MTPPIIMALIMGFMAFIYEPILMYANNIDDFWFDLGIMIKPSLIGFLITATVIVIMYLIIDQISIWTKKKGLYNFFVFFGFFVLITSYIHGNFLTGFLPSLDGSVPAYNEFLPNFVSAVVYLAGAVGVYILATKTKQPTKYVTYISLSIFAMLLVSFVATIFTTEGVFDSKDPITTATYKNINTASSNKNFMIILVDTVDSKQFNKVVSSNPEYQKTFKDFSYFPDTVSGYGFTRDAVPFFFSNIWNENETDFSVYSTNAYDNSQFFAALKDKNYLSNLYSRDYVWRSDKVYNFDNIASLSHNVKIVPFLKQEIKYALFKYLPYALKGYSSADTLDFTYAKEEDQSFWWGNKQFYHDTLNNPISEKTTQKYFQYIHLEGAHVPFDEDENVNRIENGTYEQKLTASFKVIEKYINRLKDAGVYDNSVIVVMADHSGDFEGTARQNPILYIKGVNETHSQMRISEKQVSHADLSNAFTELLEDKKSTEIFADVPTDGRIRRFLFNEFNKEEHMIEYEQTGKAWDKETLKATGRVFDL